MTHEDYKELLAANALTALDAADARALNTHLESCADCRAEMDQWQNTAAALVLDARSLEPSPAVRERILGSIGVLTSAHKLLRQHAEPGSVGSSRVIKLEQSRKDVWSRGRSLGSLGNFSAIAAVLAVVALVFSLVWLWQENRTTQQRLARLSAELIKTKEQLTREREAIALLTSPGARMAELAGTNVAPAAHAMIAYDKNGHAMLMAQGLPDAPKGMGYQLWFIVDNKPMPGKIFQIGPSGEGMLRDEVPAEALKAAVFAITLEPETGVKAPTGAIYLRSASS